eukprot:1422559-Rhodomonas_salina.1
MATQTLPPQAPAGDEVEESDGDEFVPPTPASSIVNACNNARVIVPETPPDGAGPATRQKRKASRAEGFGDSALQSPAAGASMIEVTAIPISEEVARESTAPM